MTLELWRPMREMRRLTDELERMMEEAIEPFERHWERPGVAMRFFPVNMYRQNNDVIVEATLPGVRPEDVDISVSGNTLTIRAERKEEKERKEEDYYYREVGTARFFRQLTLPSEVQADKAEARYENGILRLRLPMSGAAKESHIKVKAA
ncbi:MAG: Hsp20/alpha crystallin family protein [Sphingomonadaceae bacterium]